MSKQFTAFKGVRTWWDLYEPVTAGNLILLECSQEPFWACLFFMLHNVVEVPNDESLEIEAPFEHYKLPACQK